MNKFIIPFFLLIIAFSNAQEQNYGAECEQVMQEPMSFLVDGSFVNEKALERNLYILTACGLDQYDVSFFGSMDNMSGILRSLTKQIPIEQLTYGDLMEKISPILSSEKYLKIKKMTQRSDELGTMVGNEQTWPQDRLIFEELGASQRIIDAVAAYLKEHPNNLKTYREILMSFNKD